MKTIELAIRILLLAALAAAVSACATKPVGTPLQSSESAAMPTLSVGDSWTYHVRDGYTGLDRGTRRHQVVEVTGDRIGMMITLPNGVEESWAFDQRGNWLKHPAHGLQTFDYSPAYPAFDFPIAPGKTWHARLTATDPATKWRFPVWIDGSVLGWERIKVPAGEFDAIRVKRVVYFDYYDYTTRGRSEYTEFEWYVPAVKQAVRREAYGVYFSHMARGRGSHGFLRPAVFNDGSNRAFLPDEYLITELTAYTVR